MSTGSDHAHSGRPLSIARVTSASVRLTCYGTLLTLLFSVPLARLVQHAAATDLHSHVPLVPFAAAYLLHERRHMLPGTGTGAVGPAIALAVIALSALAAAGAWRGAFSVNDHLALMTSAYVSLLAAGGFLLRGRAWMGAAAFPFGFMLFLVPLPDAAVYALELGSLYASAEAAALYFDLAGTDVLRDGTVFELPDITLHMARECSGIRSSWALLITSVLAADMFLKTHRRRLLLVACVIPLGILRNGFRVFVLGWLSVHVGPHVLDSALHHRGGPLFFGLSLLPLFTLLWWLRHGERRQAHMRLAPRAASRPPEPMTPSP